MRDAKAKAFSLLGLLSRFGLAGLVNTAIGLSVIAALDLGLHVDPHIANAVGYAGGLASGYVLNRIFVFKSREDVARTGMKYLAVVAAAFAVNQGVLAVAGPLFGPAPLARLAAQVTAMACYTVLTFVLCRLWVFRQATTRDLPPSGCLRHATSPVDGGGDLPAPLRSGGAVGEAD